MFFVFAALALATERVEITVAAGDEASVIPAGDQGVVLYVRRKGDKKNFQIRGYDTSFQPTWNAETRLDKKYWEADYDTDDKAAWMLLQRAGKDTQLLHTDLSSGTTSTHMVPLTKSVNVNGRVEADGSGGAYVAANSGKQGVLSYVHTDGASRSLTVDKKHLVLDLVGTRNGVQAALRPFAIGPDSVLTVLDLKDGAVASTTEIRANGEELLLSGQIIEADDRRMVVGTYQPTGTLLAGARGMFVATLDGNSQTGFVKHDFGEFEGLANWLPEKKEARVEAAREKQKEKGKTTKIRMRLLVSDAIALDEGTLLVAEAYHPVYRTYTTTQTISNGQGGTTTTTTIHTVFMGWRFTHAVMAAFDDSGERLWDHSLPLDGKLTRVIAPHVRLLSEGSDVGIVFPYRGQLHRAVVENGEVVVDTEVIDQREVGADEDTIKNLQGDVTHWHGDTFLAWGTDKVRDENAKKGRAFWFTTLDGTN
jgi:hypothetical protein